MGLLDGSEGLGKFAVAHNGGSGWGILEAGQHLIAGMLHTTGTGTPEDGQAFAQSARQFRGAEQTVASACPTHQWTGAAARAYADRNARQADRAASMAVLDRGVHAVIAREADQVSHHRENLGGQAAYLANLRSAAGSMALVPGVGQALRSAIELTAVNAALATSTSELHELTREVGENAAALQAIAGEYSTLTVSPRDRDVPQAVAADQKAVGADQQAAAAEAGPQPPADTTNALASAAGGLGGVVGAVVAPLAGVLAGVAGAAGQSLGLLASAVPSAESKPETATVDDIATAEIAEPERRDADALMGAAADDAPAATGPAESEEQAVEQRDKLGQERTPAATRPPQ